MSASRLAGGKVTGTTVALHPRGAIMVGAEADIVYFNCMCRFSGICKFSHMRKLSNMYVSLVACVSVVACASLVYGCLISSSLR